MKKGWLLSFGLLMLIAIEILKVYFIMPFPGSQAANTIDIAYFIHNNIWWMRLLIFALILFPAIFYLRKGKLWQTIAVIIVVALYGFIFYNFNFKFLADKMFYQPRITAFTNDTTHNLNKLIIGVLINGESKAYPVEIIGYHHQVLDTVGGEPIMVTYCTVCRTGRVYSPVVNGKYEKVRLVGMDHFNAMFEDATTKSWWRQATGVAIAGKLKGTQLKEIISAQMSLEDWLKLHPNSVTLLPDSNFTRRYDNLKGFDEGTINSSLEKRDSASWKFKSWVVGVKVNNAAKAYDWNMLQHQKLIQDSIDGVPLLLSADTNAKDFFVLNRKINGQSLSFTYDAPTALLHDQQTNSTWQISGLCIDGPSKGNQLEKIQSYQEFWHSWQSFHPETEMYKP